MSPHVNGHRPYRSPAREEQARNTRRQIVAAAHQLFLADGFAATTIPAVATGAGVSVQTVYKVFGNKSGLAKAVFDVAIAGDDEAVPVVDRARLMEVRAEPDARRKLALYGDHLAAVAPRHVPLQLVIRDAAATHHDAAAVWAELQAERLRGMAMFAAVLAEEGQLRTGVSRSAARDVLWTYNSAEVFQLLVLERGWSAKRYGRWVADALVAALLPLPDHGDD
jgi:AcrR family transcriptional regulator